MLNNAHRWEASVLDGTEQMWLAVIEERCSDAFQILLECRKGDPFP